MNHQNSTYCTPRVSHRIVRSFPGRGILFLGFCFCFLLLLAFTSQEVLALGVTPTRFELTVAPGEELTQAIQILNTTHEPIHVKSMLFDFDQREGQMMMVPAGTTPASSAAWVQFTPKELDLSPQDKTFIRFTVSVPKEAQGEYRTVLRLEELPELAPTQSGTVFGIRMNIPLYIQVRGTERPHATILDMSLVYTTPLSRVQRFDYPLLVYVQVKNDGNVHLRPNGLLVVQEKKTGKVVYEQPLANDDPVLPGNEMTLKTGLKEWQTQLAGDYELLVTLNYFPDAPPLIQKKAFTILEDGGIR